MNIDPTYKPAEITDDMDLDNKLCGVLLRMVSFTIANKNITLMSLETTKRIIGDDKYTILVLEALSKGFETSDDRTNYIKRELQEML